MPDALSVGSLFSGIGGLDLGLERAGMRVKWQCEIDPFCQAVLRYHWPDVTLYGDIRELTDAEPVDLICGGFPCQPVSLAGKGLAQEDPRWLWPEFARVVRLLRPSYVIVENVPGLVKRGLLDVLTDLAEMGFDAEWQIVSAASVGAPHIRERIFVVAFDPSRNGTLAYSHGFGSSVGREAENLVGTPRAAEANGEQWQRRRDAVDDRCSDVAYANGSGCSEQWWAGAVQKELLAAQRKGWWEFEPEVGRVANGVPNRVAQLRALGNAVVPQVAEFVGRLIVQAAA